MLQQLLDDKNKAILQSIQSYAKSMWTRGLYPAPWTVIHGVPHSEAIIKMLDKMLETYMTSKHKLNEAEILVLLGAAWLHDIGYLPKEKEADYKKRFEEIRASHPVRGYDHILKNSSDCGGREAAPLIALCVKGHKELPSKLEEYENGVLESDIVRVHFLTALLKLADELDLGAERAPRPFFQQIKRYYGELPEETVLRWMRHFYTAGIRLESSTRNGIDIRISVQTYVPSKEYEEYIVGPYIVQPIKTAVLETYYALARESLIVDPHIKPNVMILRETDPLPYEIYSHLERQILDRQAWTSLMRYDFQRVCEFLERTELENHVFKSTIVRARNSISYTLVNNSSEKRYVSGNGAFLSFSTDAYEIPLGRSMGKSELEAKLGFKMWIKHNKRRQRAKVHYVLVKKASDLPENISAIMEKLKRFKSFKDKVFCLYRVSEEKGLKTIKSRFLLLEPILSGASLGIEYSWLSTFLPWDTVVSAMRLPTKGISIRFEKFPDELAFGMSENLLIEKGEKPGQEREPIFDSSRGIAARKFERTDLFAPGTQIVVSWKDTTQSLQTI